MIQEDTLSLYPTVALAAWEDNITVRYKQMAINRPIVLKRGIEGEIECNTINAYLNEWVVFKLPMSEGSFGELRMPIEDAFEQGLIVAADKIDLYEDEEEF